MRISDVMSRSLTFIEPNAPLSEAAAKMKDWNVGFLPVCEFNRIVGLVTDRDITVRAVAHGEDPKAVMVRDVMTEEIVHCFDDDLVTNAAQLMKEHQVRRLIVLDHDKHLVGVVSLGDLAVETGDQHLAGSTLDAVCTERPAGGANVCGEDIFP